MKEISELLKLERPIELKQAKSFRAHLLDQFIERLEADRIGTKWEVKDSKKFSRLICVKINSNPFLKDDSELDYFLRRCKEARSFGKYFNWFFNN